MSKLILMETNMSKGIGEHFFFVITIYYYIFYNNYIYSKVELITSSFPFF
jgi:hypothetical protein